MGIDDAPPSVNSRSRVRRSPTSAFPFSLGLAYEGRGPPLGLPMERPRIVFMGTPALAVPSLEACRAVGEVVAVVTQPDRPRDRGHAVHASAVKAAAAGLKVLQPERLKGTDFAETLAALRPEVAVVTAYGRILPPDVLAAPARGCLNVHASLLPRWRGAAPIQWAIAEGDAETGVCLMQMESGLDTGPVLAARREAIREEDTAETLGQRLALLAGELLREALPPFFRRELTAVPQPAQGVTLARLVERADGWLDFAQPARVLWRRTRAFTPWPGTFTSLSGRLLKVHQTQVASGLGPPGTLLAADGGLEVACGEGSLVLLEVQPEGRRRMGVKEFLRGHPLDVGTRPFGDAPL
jgi:methionyl-tRNA formyltransferase